MSDCITFLLNGERVEARGVDPTSTLLDWLRENPRLRGTKEGCAEGDCGACTVILERLAPDGSIGRTAVTSCILLLGQIDGLGVRTIEGVGSPGTPGYFLQTEMAQNGGTQCGFCTPGFIMAGAALLSTNSAPTPGEIHDAIAGNLCRCTGYRPIVEAVASAAAGYRRAAPETGHADDLGAQLAGLAASTSGDRRFEAAGRRIDAPSSMATLLALRAAHPEIPLVAGATDLGLLAGRDRDPPPALIRVTGVPELESIAWSESGLEIGAAVSYQDALGPLLELWPELTDYMARLGSAQVRGAGTIGGNLATASPIGDMAPVLIALGADVRLASVRGERALKVEDFLIGYRKTALAPDEVIRAIAMPRRKPGEQLAAEKLSRRRDQDISTLTAVFRIRLAGDRVEDCCIAFGGMADRALRAHAVEDVLRGQPFTPATLGPARAAILASFTPIDDVRAPASYRRNAAANLLDRVVLKMTRPDLVLELERL